VNDNAPVFQWVEPPTPVIPVVVDLAAINGMPFARVWATDRDQPAGDSSESVGITFSLQPPPPLSHGEGDEAGGDEEAEFIRKCLFLFKFLF
jgi:hypothetical protein